ncbi:hypothetical protein Tsubulata_022865 [Turnera subulata]|uniref:UBC core domain-containing protein n=1 Tax=Turnera subulata TaxID=218843 RepID=A0A9Q0FBE1_9ROSI|nr:hypothetical protein Tsubulata_022865 [Turnera subulata]
MEQVIREQMNNVKRHGAGNFSPNNGNLLEIEGYIMVKHGLYALGSEGMKWRVTMTLPEDYPLNPPTLVQFHDPIWHPYVCSNSGHLLFAPWADTWATGTTLLRLVRDLIGMLENIGPDTHSQLQLAHCNLEAAQDLADDYHRFGQQVADCVRATRIILDEIPYGGYLNICCRGLNFLNREGRQFPYFEQAVGRQITSLIRTVYVTDQRIFAEFTRLQDWLSARSIQWTPLIVIDDQRLGSLARAFAVSHCGAPWNSNCGELAGSTGMIRMDVAVSEF